MSDTAIQRLRREEQWAVADVVRTNILFIERHGYHPDEDDANDAAGTRRPPRRPREYTSPPRTEVVHQDEDPDEDDANDAVGNRRPPRINREEPPGIRVRRNDPQPQEYVVQEQHRRNAPPRTRRSPRFTPARWTNRASFKSPLHLTRRQQRAASRNIEARTRALREHREMMGPVIFEGPAFHIDDGLVPDLDLDPIY